MSQPSADILIERHDSIVRIQFNRPRKKNALKAEMYHAAREALEAADADPTIRVVYITGSGDSFTAGHDLNSFLQTPGSDAAARFGVDTLIPFSVTQGALDNPIQLDPTLPDEHEAFMHEFARKYDLGDLPPHEIPVFDPYFIREQLDVVLEMAVPPYVAGIGDPGFMVERAHQIGMKIGVVVGATRHAYKSLRSGVDFMVAQGHDGGGHNSLIGTMALIPQVVDAVAGRVPVLGAGSIMDGRQMVAALALGAQGVWCGSAFLATPEAQLTDAQKQKIVEHDERGTVLSRSFTGKRAHVLSNVWANEFDSSGLSVLPMHQQLTMTDRVMRAANEQNRVDINPGAAGQGIGMVKKIRPAADVLMDIISGASEILERGVLG